MLKSIRHAALAAILAVGAMGASATAEARDRYRDRGDDAALAIGAGIVGLALGAAIASDRRDDYYYRDRYYYPRGGYYQSYPRYYNYDRYPRRYYRNEWRGRDWNRGRDRGWDRGRSRGWGY